MEDSKIIKHSQLGGISANTVAIINHTLKGIKYLIQIQKLSNMRRKILNKYKIQQSPNSNIKVKFKDLYFDIVDQSEEEGLKLLDLIQNCYSKKRKNQLNLTSQAIILLEDCLKLYSSPEFISEPTNPIIQVYHTFLENFEKFKQLAQNNYEQILLIYPRQFLIEGLEKFREFYAFRKYLNYNTFSQFLIINQLLYNFLIGIVKKEMLQNGNKLARSCHIFGHGWQIDNIKDIYIPRCFDQSKWLNLYALIKKKNQFLYTEIHNFIYQTIRTPIIKTVIDSQDKKLYRNFMDFYIHKISCIFIPYCNIKGFTSNKNYIFINLYPVIKAFDVSIKDLFGLIKAYCFIVVLIALNQKLNLQQWNAKVLPIEQEIKQSECPYLELYKQTFGIDSGGQCNLKVLNVKTSKAIQGLYNRFDLMFFQEQIIQVQQGCSDLQNLKLIN